MARDAAPAVRLEVTGAAGDGLGIAHRDGKVSFVEGALSGETVSARRLRSKPGYDTYRVVEVERPAADRRPPRCGVFGLCGGCTLQHQVLSGQVADKENALVDKLQRIGGVRPERRYDPIVGPEWHYRSRARLGIKFVIKKQRVLVGFRERDAPYITDMADCEILDRRVATLLPELAKIIGSLSVARRVPQVELAAGENAVVLVLRHLDPLTAEDEVALRAFTARYGPVWYLQSGGADTVRPLTGQPPVPLYYDLPDERLRLGFSPVLFSQVNLAVNRKLVARAVALLAPKPPDRIGDFFCGIGNFSLALARHGPQVVGYEATLDLVQAAQGNATANGLSRNSRFECADLNDPAQVEYALGGQFNKALLDPPRTGAATLCRALAAKPLDSLLYISCNAATLARDAAILTAGGQYRLIGAGHVDMFPHTAHAEAIALFRAR